MKVFNVALLKISIYIAKNYFCDTEPFPYPSYENAERIVSLINTQCNYLGKDRLYKNFKSLAVGIWYEITKQHLLENGNKRVAFACFLVFCYINKKIISFKKPPEKLCLEIAKSNDSIEGQTKQDIINQISEKVVF